MDSRDSRELARRVRIATLKMVHRARASHVGSCLSAVDVLAVLYQDVLELRPEEADFSQRDRFVLSKGHAAAALYAVLSQRGFFPASWLDSFSADGSLLYGHSTSHGVPGIEISTGSLGHGLSLGCGMALAAKRAGQGHRVFVLLSDGECDEGSVWEAALFAPHHGLDNLVAIIDYNKIQSFGRVRDVLDLEPLLDKWQACRWATQEVDGHDHHAVRALLQSVPFTPGRPSAVVAHTVKGKGVSFMEDDLRWHYSPPSDEELAQALAQLGGEAP